ncbi:hypothetical protein CXG81DRAFT_6212, partial [Caulochytrium protostelioides]
FECDLCGRQFKLKQYLTRHRRDIHQRPFHCPIENCHASFHLERKLAAHVAVHASGKPFICEVDECEAAYRRPSDLKRHVKDTH